MRDRKRAYLFFVVLTAVYMAASFAHPVTPTMIQNRGFGDYIFGVALASMMTANFLISPFWGKAISAISSRNAFLIGSLGYAIGQGLFGLARTEAMVVFARMFAGTFASGLFTATLTYIVNTSPDESRGSYLTASATIQIVAGSFGYFVGGMLGEIHWGVTMATQVVALATCGLLLRLLCEDDKGADSAKVDFKAFFKEANPISAFRSAGHIMTPLFIALFVVSGLANLGNTAFDQSFNYYIKAQFGLSSGYNGALKAVTGFVALLVNGTLGLYVINKTDARLSSIWVHFSCALTILSIFFVDSVALSGIFAVIYFGLLAIAIPLTQNLVAGQVAGKDSNLIMASYNSVKSLGGIFGSLLAGILYTVDPKSPFILGVASFIVATLAAAYYYHLGRKKDAEAVFMGEPIKKAESLNP